MPPELPFLVGALAAFAFGYLVGSLPVAATVGRRYGVELTVAGDRNPGAANAWATAGPVAGVIALAGDLGKGFLPTAIAAATGGWGAGWLAALGALTGHAWPALGRRRGGRAVATFAGGCIGLVPPAGLAAVLTLALMALVARAAGHRPRVAAIAAGIASYPLFAFSVERDAEHLAAIGLLYLLALARFTWTGRRRVSGS